MTEIEAYQEYVRRRHDAFCRAVIRCAAIWEIIRLQQKWGREISLDYLTNEKFIQFSGLEPYGEYHFTACGQTAILGNGDLAAALSRLSEQEQEELFAYYFQKKKQGEIAARYGRTRSTAGRHIQIALRKLREEMERCRHE